MGGPNKLADEQCDKVLGWMNQYSIENLVRGRLDFNASRSYQREARYGLWYSQTSICDQKGTYTAHGSNSRFHHLPAHGNDKGAI